LRLGFVGFEATSPDVAPDVQDARNPALSSSATTPSP